MAGVSLQVTVDDRELNGKLRALERRLGDLKPFYADWSEALLRSHRERMGREETPEGKRWQALSPAYAKWKRAKRPRAKILAFDGYLKRLNYRVSSDSLTLGAEEIYGAIHQLGGEAGPKTRRVTIPARPYLGLSEADREYGLELIEEYLDG